MSEIAPDRIVEDWGGFEKLVAKLHETGSVKVEHNVVLTGVSGAPRQIDVLVRHTKDFYEHLIIVECKHWKKNVSRLHVDALATAVKDLKASKGVIFTLEGFQEGAITAAESFGIDLFKVREFSDEEWGRPGRIIDFYIQFFQRSIGDLQVQAAVANGQQPIGPLALTMNIAGEVGDEGSSETATLNADGSAGKSVEEIVIKASADALEKVMSQNILLEGEDEVTRYAVVPVTIQPPQPIMIPRDGTIIYIQKIDLKLGVKITQTRFKHDRAEQYRFALAVENRITGAVAAASRKEDAATTEVKPLSSPASAKGEGAVVNGSIMKITLKGFFSFGEITNPLA